MAKNYDKNLHRKNHPDSFHKCTLNKTSIQLYCNYFNTQYLLNIFNKDAWNMESLIYIHFSISHDIVKGSRKAMITISCLDITF